MDQTTPNQSQAAPAPDTLETKTGHIDRMLFDQPYAGLSAAQKLDISWPSKGEGPFPVILAIQGGAFRFGDKRDQQLEPMLLALSRGYPVV